METIRKITQCTQCFDNIVFINKVIGTLEYAPMDCVCKLTNIVGGKAAKSFDLESGEILTVLIGGGNWAGMGSDLQLCMGTFKMKKIIHNAYYV